MGSLRASAGADNVAAMDTTVVCTSKVHMLVDDPTVRSAMAQIIAASGLQSVEYRTTAELVRAVYAGVSGCVVIDIAMREIDGVELMHRLQPRALAPPFIFVATVDDVSRTVEAMKCGAVDCIVKPAESERVGAAVRRALEIDAARRELRSLRARFDKLTSHERAILFGIADNKLNKQIALELGVCERTVKSRRARMMNKLCVATVPEIVRTVASLEKTEGWRIASRAQPTPNASSHACAHGAGTRAAHESARSDTQTSLERSACVHARRDELASFKAG
jgi:FixJ family two-component response regulator